MILNFDSPGSTLFVLSNNISSVPGGKSYDIQLKNELIQNFLIVQLSNNIINLNYSISDINGIGLIKSSSLETNSSELKIDFEKYPNGIYFFNTEINGQNYHLKFIKD